MPLLKPSEIFTEKEKKVAKDIYFLASETLLDVFNPFANKERMRERILAWREKLDELLGLLEVR
jgi:hypothetical protein